MASALVGAVVGGFVVGDGTLVGQTTFQPAKVKLNLKGKGYITRVVSDLKLNTLSHQPDLTLKSKAITVIVSGGATYAAGPKLIARGKPIRLVTPTKTPQGKPRMIERGRPFGVVVSPVIAVGKSRLILRGGRIKKVGRAGMIPSVPQAGLLTPTPAGADADLAPSPAQAETLTPSGEVIV